MPVTVYTVGHSNRTLEALLGILRAHGIECLADVRTVPRSRHNPQFNAETLEKLLPGAGVAYHRLPRLRGPRRAPPGSPHPALRHDRFPCYPRDLEKPPL